MLRALTPGFRIVAVAAATAVVLLATTTLAHASCDAACQITEQHWQMVNPGPLLRFRNSDRPSRIEIAVAAPAQPPSGAGADWAKARLAGPQGGFGPLGDCRGDLPAGTITATTLTCSVPPAADVRRVARLFAVKSDKGMQVIGSIEPASIEQNQLNLEPLLWLANEGGGSLASAARSAIAVFMGKDYYIARGAGAQGPAIEAVYHFWDNQLEIMRGLIDHGADYVLFKNGEVWRNPGAGPRDINPAAFRVARWHDCGTWRSKAGSIAVTMNGNNEVLLPANQLQRFEPATTGATQRVEGNWVFGYEVFAGQVMTPYAQMYLHADGSLDLLGLPEAPQDANPAPGQHRRGHYRIDGYTIDIDYDDGVKHSALFCWAGHGHYGHYVMFLINGSSWVGDLVG